MQFRAFVVIAEPFKNPESLFVRWRVVIREIGMRYFRALFFR
jgi:hypothetical protein